VTEGSDIDAPVRTARLAHWVADVLQVAVEGLDPIPGGGSRSSYVVRAGGKRYLLRVDDGFGPLSGTVFTIGREFRIISALHAAGFAVPAIYGHNEAMNALLMEFVDGSTHFPPDAPAVFRSKVQSDLMRKVVDLHAFDPAALGLDTFASLATVNDAVADDLARLAKMYRAPGVPAEPEIDFALAWLSRNVPEGPKRAAIVHGDVGPGNFIFADDGRVRALIDWEVVHMGHKLEDLAAVMCRALGSPFGEGPDHIRTYEDLTGERVDRLALEYCLILVMTRWYIGLNIGLSHPSHSQNLPVILVFRQSVAFTLVSLLARHHEIQTQDPVPVSTGADSFMHDYLIYGLDNVLRPALQDPFLVERTSGLSMLAKYFRDLSAYGAERLERAEQAEIERLLGSRYGSWGAARKALCLAARDMSGEDIPRLLECLMAVSARRQGIWASAMGPMAARRLVY
jgi:aminoglycoside phosphotransferase (APT) family kinase protein